MCVKTETPERAPVKRIRTVSKQQGKKMTKEDIVKQIIKDVGGSDNINNAWHCMTRLRFDLKDEKKSTMRR